MMGIIGPRKRGGERGGGGLSKTNLSLKAELSQKAKLKDKRHCIQVCVENSFSKSFIPLTLFQCQKCAFLLHLNL